MKVLLANLHFWPDTPPNAIMLRYLAEAIAKNDHDVTVVAAQPCYKNNYNVALAANKVEMPEGYHVHRVNLGFENKNKFTKLKVFFGYALFLFYKILKEKPDRTIISTNPPILAAFTVRMASKITGGDYAYHCQDLHPEIAGVSGALSTNNILYKLLRNIEKKNCEQAFRTIVLSEDMQQALLARHPSQNRTRNPIDNVRIINNYELREIDDKNEKNKHPLPVEMLRENNKFRIIFAGNIGRFQGLQSIIEVAHLLKDIPEIEFVFLGEGSAGSELKEQAKELLNHTVKFFGHQPINIARTLIADSQLGIVSLSKDIYKYAYPSKTMTYLCEGIPILAVVEAESSLARHVNEEQLGITSEISTPDDMARQIRALYEDNLIYQQVKEKATQYATQHYSVEAVLPRLVEAFCEEAK